MLIVSNLLSHMNKVTCAYGVQESKSLQQSQQDRVSTKKIVRTDVKSPTFVVLLVSMN